MGHPPHTQRRCPRPESCEVHLPGDRTDIDNATTTSGHNELRGATRPRLLYRPGLGTALGLPTESMTT